MPQRAASSIAPLLNAFAMLSALQSIDIEFKYASTISAFPVPRQ
jgi:hypothetical protein